MRRTMHFVGSDLLFDMLAHGGELRELAEKIEALDCPDTQETGVPLREQLRNAERVAMVARQPLVGALIVHLAARWNAASRKA